MMGLTPREARARLDDIIAFAELERFVDQKLKNYSSGMQVRLAFSVMVQSDPDVMLIDEVLAVGDAAFQQKCIDVFYRLRGEGKTIVLVTHEMGLVERFCHRAMKLSGRRHHPHRRSGRDRPRLPERELRRLRIERRREAPQPAEVRLVDAWVTDTKRRARRRDRATATWMRAQRRDRGARGRSATRASTLWLTNEDGVRVFSAGAREDGEALGDLEAGERIQFSIDAPEPALGRPLLRRLRRHPGLAPGSRSCCSRTASPTSSPTAQNLHGLVGIDYEPT